MKIVLITLGIVIIVVLVALVILLKNIKKLNQKYDEICEGELYYKREGFKI